MNPKKTHSIIFLFALFCVGKVYGQPATWSDQQAMVHAFEWQEQHPIFAIAPTDWTNGVYYLGVTRAYQKTNDQRYLAALKNMGYWNEWNPMYRTHHADDITISYSYLFVSTTRKNLVNLTPTQTWIDKHLYEPHRWKEGNTKNIQQCLWWWCDALFMAPPVITYYAKLTNQSQYLDTMHHYYRQTYDLLYDKEEHLFARDLRYVWKGSEQDLKEKNGKKIFWSRGNGWVLGGLALILDNMPNNYPHRPFYEKLFREMAARIIELQHADGLWRTSLLGDNDQEHGEESGSGLYTFAIAWGINNGLLDASQYKPAVIKAWKALRQCQHPNGMIGWVQNIGDSPQKADANSWQNFGTGAFLLAGSEMIHLK